jgi:DNA-binding transcriptional LysR family regulator
MDLYQLETFLAVAEEKGFSRAATRMRRTQPAISHAIRKLEEEIGQPLFERASRDATLTATGKLLRTFAERLLRLRGETITALEELRSLERGRLTIAANEYTCLWLLPVLDEFRRDFPQIGITVQRSLASQIPDQLLERAVEFGILSFRPEDARLHAIAVYTDSVAFVVDPKHPLAKQNQVSIRELGTQHGCRAAQPRGHQALRGARPGRRAGSWPHRPARARPRRIGAGRSPRTENRPSPLARASCPRHAFPRWRGLP